MGPSPRRVLICLASLLVLASVAHAARSLATERGWRPALILTGEGDPTRAVAAMRSAAELWRITLHNSDVDPATHEFTQRAIESFKDFDLKGMHELLPVPSGPYRELRVQGERKGNRYIVGQPEDAQFEVSPEGMREHHGDASMVLRSRGVAASDGDTNYLIQARAGIVVGKVGWPMIMESNRAWLRLMAGNDNPEPAARPMVAVRQTAIEANPKLGQEDLDLVATLWEAFPRMSYLVSSLGRIDDLVVAGQHQGATHVRLVLRIDVSRMAERYPELAEYLDDLGKLFRWDVSWLDDKGRTLATAHIDSETLQARIELYTKDGFILPFKGSQVFVDEPVDPSRGPLRYTTAVRSDFRMMGMYSHMRDGRMDWHYEPTPRGMQLHGRMTHVPTITVDGAALGFIPPGLVDAFIPGDLDSLITQFLTTACHGNEGRGIALTVRLDQRPSTVSTIDAKLGFEALNNFLVKLGVGFFNDRVMPNEDVSAEFKRLMVDAQGAFSADVERFARGR